jgi:hypothetical protein
MLGFFITMNRHEIEKTFVMFPAKSYEKIIFWTARNKILEPKAVENVTFMAKVVV